MDQAAPTRSDDRRPRPRNGPLAGIRIADFGWMGVGSCATRLLADYGADVIKIEDRSRLDNIRRLPFYRGSDRTYGDAVPGADPDLGGLHNNYSRNKLGVTINMRTEEGRELAWRLMSECSIVSENFAPGVMERWGITYEALRERVPDVIFARMSGFGQDGPQRDYRAYGPVVQATCGLSYAGGLAGLPPSGYGFSYMDNMAASFASSALLLAILRRRRTGLGTQIDISAQEVGVNLVGPVLLEAAANHPTYPLPGFPPGNRLLHGEASPHGVYQCAGDDRWIAITAFNDEQWVQLCDVLGLDADVLDESFATVSGRQQAQDDVDKAVSAATSQWDPFELEARLQAVGIPAGAVQNPREIIERDAQLKHRTGTFFELDHPKVGPALFEGSPALFGSTRPDNWRSAPMLGEDNDYVFGEILGMSRDERDALSSKGVI